MNRMRRLLAPIALLLSIGACRAEEAVQFPSLAGPHAATLDGRVFRAEGEGRHPALLFLQAAAGSSVDMARSMRASATGRRA
jgi:hypothetical protein